MRKNQIQMSAVIVLVACIVTSANANISAQGAMEESMRAKITRVARGYGTLIAKGDLAGAKTYLYGPFKATVGIHEFDYQAAFLAFELGEYSLGCESFAKRQLWYAEDQTEDTLGIRMQGDCQMALFQSGLHNGNVDWTPFKLRYPEADLYAELYSAAINSAGHFCFRYARLAISELVRLEAPAVYINPARELLARKVAEQNRLRG